jgi:hypothetical protein
MQPIHLAASGGKTEIIDVLIGDYGVSAQTEVYERIAYYMPIIQSSLTFALLDLGKSISCSADKFGQLQMVLQALNWNAELNRTGSAIVFELSRIISLTQNRKHYCSSLGKRLLPCEASVYHAAIPFKAHILIN